MVEYYSQSNPLHFISSNLSVSWSMRFRGLYDIYYLRFPWLKTDLFGAILLHFSIHRF